MCCSPVPQFPLQLLLWSLLMVAGKSPPPLPPCPAGDAHTCCLAAGTHCAAAGPGLAEEDRMGCRGWG